MVADRGAEEPAEPTDPRAEIAPDAAGAPSPVAAAPPPSDAGLPPPHAGLPPSDAALPPVGVLELEALLFVAERPLSRREIAALTGLEREAVDGLLGDLEVLLRGRGVRVVASEERVELATAPEAGALIARYVGADGVRLSPAALETLAIVAYRQPVTRGAIERIRGVDSDHVVRSLLHRRLVVEQGRADTPGRPILYATGFEFMERFGLTSLDDLPPLDPEVAARLVVEPDDAADETAGSGPDRPTQDAREQADDPTPEPA